MPCANATGISLIFHVCLSVYNMFTIASARFASVSAEQIKQIFEEISKDSKNTKRLPK